ncbi:hypothetical protein [Candidatus Burkholderia verschuerenii]|uniref:hypothetical protein n=1 Tax=Candidatus Burkholderia verschuerenii TaxID=242163 RepID=UPI000A9F3312
MKKNPFIFSALVLALAGCGGGSNSPASATNAAESGNSSSASGSSSVANAADVTDQAVSKATAALRMSCSTASVASASGGSGQISVDTPNSDGSRMYPINAKINVAFTTRAGSADTLKWTINNLIDKPVASGTISVPAAATTSTITCTSTQAGFFAVRATLVNGGGQVQYSGTRPNGFATFGVIPDLSSVLPAVKYTKQEQHRFGMQGFNNWQVMLSALGITSQIDDRQMSVTEPNGPNTFNPSTSMAVLDSFYRTGEVMRLVRLDGIPGWASAHGLSPDYSYAPADLSYSRTT